MGSALSVLGVVVLTLIVAALFWVGLMALAGWVIDDLDITE